jgi:glycosyltransferase involved in cell wall biosynthesis
MTRLSIILATRNRPQLFERALDSVLAQTGAEVEIIVINDGSNDEHAAAYHTVLASRGGRVRLFSLIQRPIGHGQSYALNFGVAQSSGDYVGFLDDDDEWRDPGYLARVAAVITRDSETVDLHIADQAAFHVDGRQQPAPIWVEDMGPRLQQEGRRPEAHGAYRVDVDDLLKCHGFAHLNTLIVRRGLFDAIGGLDEGLRYENDRDFYLRVIDRAQVIRYTPGIISRHNIPDPGKANNMSTMLAEVTKHNLQFRLLTKANCFSAHPQIRQHARRHMVFALKKLAEGLAAEGRYSEAVFYARLAFGGRPAPKWAAFMLLLLLRGAGRR